MLEDAVLVGAGDVGWRRWCRSEEVGLVGGCGDGWRRRCWRCGLQRVVLVGVGGIGGVGWWRWFWQPMTVDAVLVV